MQAASLQISTKSRAWSPGSVGSSTRAVSAGPVRARKPDGVTRTGASGGVESTVKLRTGDHADALPDGVQERTRQ